MQFISSLLLRVKDISNHEGKEGKEDLPLPHPNGRE
jgi:hypothetical protein